MTLKTACRLFMPYVLPPPSSSRTCLQLTIKRLMRLLTRLGYLVEEQGMTYLAHFDPDNTLGPLQAAACTYRIAFGPRAGQKVLSLFTAAPAPVAPATAHRCVDAQGFNLHAERRLAINQRHKLEELCRYITRPAIANERLAVNPAGQVVLTLKTPYRDGTTQIVMDPLEFMQRLAALVPRPRLHLIRFHGVLAPHAKLRSAIVPSASTEPTTTTPDPVVEIPVLSLGAHQLGLVAQAGLRYGLANIVRTAAAPCRSSRRSLSPPPSRRSRHLGLSARAPPRSPVRHFALLSKPPESHTETPFLPASAPLSRQPPSAHTPVPHQNAPKRGASGQSITRQFPGSGRRTRRH